MRKFDRAFVSVSLLLVVSAAVVWAAVTPYSQDFEGLPIGDVNALANDGWNFYVNVAAPTPYGYGGPAPNGPQICAIATGEGGPAQGAQQLSVYSDYNNGDHGNGYLIETNVYQEQTIEAGDVGVTVDFTFDAKLGNLGGSSTALAFIKTLDPNNGYAQTNFVTQNTTNTPATWTTYNLQLAIDAGLVGQILQIGFSTTATNYEPCGVFYDNVNQPVPVELMSLSVE
jgi:hypothetical protein